MISSKFEILRFYVSVFNFKVDASLQCDKPFDNAVIAYNISIKLLTSSNNEKTKTA